MEVGLAEASAILLSFNQNRWFTYLLLSNHPQPNQQPGQRAQESVALPVPLMPSVPVLAAELKPQITKPNSAVLGEETPAGAMGEKERTC